MDLLYLFITAVSAFFIVLVAALVVFFAIKYRRRHPDEVGADIHGSLALELTWTVIPFVLSMVMFVWGADLFFRLARPPRDAMDIFVVGKQWMWKVQHPEGVREINELHVPIGRHGAHHARLRGRAARLLHPGVPREDGRGPRQADDAVVQGDACRATYHLFCAEYCGTKHSGMIGKVIAMDAARLRSLARRRHGRRGSPVADRRDGCSPDLRLRHVPQGGCERPRPGAGRPVRQPGGARPTAARSSPTTTTCASRS